MKLSVLDELLEESFLPSLERASPAAQKYVSKVAELEKEIKGCLDDEKKKKLEQLLSAHWDLFDAEQNDRFKSACASGFSSASKCSACRRNFPTTIKQKDLSFSREAFFLVNRQPITARRNI